jgi:glyoxylate/succinic semialdehyde reductase
MAADSPTPTKLGFIGAGIMGASRIRPKPETLRFFGGARKPPPRGGSLKRLRVVVVRRFFADRFVSAVPSNVHLRTCDPKKQTNAGVPMALNLMKAGHELTVWNRTAAACQPLVDAGATLAGSAAEACAASDVTFVMVSTPEAAMACAEAAAPGLGAGKGYVDVSTVDAGTSAAVSKLVKGTGAEFLEAPVSGSKAPAEQGALIFMAAGDEPLYARVKGPLEVMGKAHFFLGDVGAGAKMKLIVNSVMGSMMASFAEGLSLTEAAALDQDTLLQIISLGAINTPMYALKGPNMIKGVYPPAFPLKHQQKDMRLALALGDELAQEMPVAAAANEMYKTARRMGKDDEDFSAVIAAIGRK